MRFSIVSRGLVVAAMVLALVACGAQAPGTGGDEDRLSVVATTTQVGSVAREVGGDAIDLTVLLAPGVEAHDFELSPAQGAAIERADLVLLSGAGLEDWLDDAIENAGASDRVRDMSEGVELRTPGDDEPTHGHDEDEHGHDEDEHGHDEDEHGHDEDNGHGHGETDPHYWLTAENAIIMTENVRDALSEAAPEEADGFADRADALIDRLEAADAEVRALIDEIPPDQRKIVTDHDAMGYFVDAYGLEFAGSVFPSLDVSSEPSAREIEALVAEIRAEGITAIFTESAVNARLAQAVAEEAGARLVEEPLYTDSLGPEGSGADTMDGMLVHNARVIRDGLLGD